MKRNIVAGFDADAKPFLNKMDRIDRRLGSFEQKTVSGLGRIETRFEAVAVSAGRSVMRIGGALGGVFAGQQLAKLSDNATRIENMLASVGATGEDAQEAVFKASVRSRAGFLATTEAVQRFHKVLGDDQTIGQTIRQVETLNKLLAVGGKSSSERASVALQLSQAIQSGTLQGDELRSLRENAPVELLQAIAKEAGVTVAGLKKAGSEGQITSKHVVGALNQMADTADQRFKAVQVTLSEAQQVFTSGVVRAVGGLDDGLDASTSIAAVLMRAGEILGGMADEAERVGEALKVVATAAGSAFAARQVGRGWDRHIAQAKATRQATADAAKADEKAAAMALQNAEAKQTAARKRLADLMAEKEAAIAAEKSKASAVRQEAEKEAQAVTASNKRKSAEILALHRKELAQAEAVARGKIEAADKAAAASKAQAQESLAQKQKLLQAERQLISAEAQRRKLRAATGQKRKRGDGLTDRQYQRAIERERALVSEVNAAQSRVVSATEKAEARRIAAVEKATAQRTAIEQRADNRRQKALAKLTAAEAQAQKAITQTTAREAQVRQGLTDAETARVVKKAGITKQAEIAASNAVMKADRAVVASKGRLAAATKATTAAVARLNIAFRASTALSRAWGASLAFVGGWPGLLLAAASAAAVYGANMRTVVDAANDAAEAADQAIQALGNIQTLESQMADAQARFASAKADDDEAEIVRLERKIELEKQLLANAKADAKKTAAEARRLFDAEFAVMRDRKVLKMSEGTARGAYGHGARSNPELRDKAEADLMVDLTGGGELSGDMLKLSKAWTAAEEARLRVIDLDQQVAENRKSLDAEGERSAVKMAQEQAERARKHLEDLQTAGERRAELQQKITELEAEGARLATASNEALIAGDRERANAAMQGWAEVRDHVVEYQEQLDRIPLSAEQTKAQLLDLLSVSEQMRDELAHIEVDEAGKARQAIAEFERKIFDAIAAGETLNQAQLSALRDEIADTANAADVLAAAFLRAHNQIDASIRSANEAIARANIRAETAGNPMEQARQLAAHDFEVQNPMLDGMHYDPVMIEARNQQQAAYVETQVRLAEANQRVAASNRAVSKSASAASSQMKLASDMAKEFIAQHQSAAEKEAEYLAKVNEARETLRNGTEEQIALGDALEESMLKAAQTAQTALYDGLVGTLVQAIKQGRSLGDTLGMLAERLIELEGMNFLTGLLGFGGGALSSLGGRAGSWLAGAIFSANGNVVTSDGAVPLRKYARGGVARSPQLSVFGEGSMPEAYVPLQDGRSIPVTIKELPQAMPTVIVQPVAPEVNMPDIGKMIALAAAGGDVINAQIDASMEIQIEGSGLTIDQVKEQLAPTFREQQRIIIDAVHEANQHDPYYLT
jgi:tape measure domain-containing protein